jgi:hypothetical protein
VKCDLLICSDSKLLQLAETHHVQQQGVDVAPVLQLKEKKLRV